MWSNIPTDARKIPTEAYATGKSPMDPRVFVETEACGWYHCGLQKSSLLPSIIFKTIVHTLIEQKLSCLALKKQLATSLAVGMLLGTLVADDDDERVQVTSHGRQSDGE